MKVVNITRAIINAEELAILEKARDVLDTLSLCNAEVSDEAIKVSEGIGNVIDDVLVCDDDEMGAYISFNEDEVIEYNFDFEVEDTEEKTD